MRNSFRALAVVAIAFSALTIAGCGGAQARKQGYLARGDKYFAEQNYDKARVEYRNAMQIDPKDAQALYAVGRTAEKLGTPKDAVGLYQAAVDADPKHTAARAALARLFLFGGVPDKALELAETGLTYSPQEPQLLTVRAAVRAQKGQTEAAFEDANTAFKAAPSDEYTVALLASLYRQSSRSDKAIEIVREGIALLPKNIDLRVVLADLEMGQRHPELAEQQLIQVVAIEPKVLAHRYRLAKFYLAQKNIDAAEAAIRDGVQADPENATAKMALVEFLASQRSAAAAEKQLVEFVAQNPKDDQLKLQLGGYYEQREQFDSAERSYREVIARSDKRPDGLMARNRLAAMFLKRNEVKQATLLIDEVLKENARDNDALIMRGNLALARGDTASAITDLRSVLRDQPGAVPVMRALARAHVQNGELALAEETLRNAVQINPQDADVRMDLARLLAQAGRFDQARPLLTQLAKEQPSNVAVQETLFRVQAAMRDFTAARATAVEFQQVHPDMALGYYLAGMVDEEESKIAAAIENYERAFKLQPKGSESLTALVRLEMTRKQPQQAMARLDRALAADPENVTASSLRAEILLSQGKADEAIVAYEAVAKKQPKWFLPYRGIAMAYRVQKNDDAAIAALKRGIENTGGETSLFLDLSSIYERRGDLSSAIESYEAWLQRDPKSIVAINNLAMLLVTYDSSKKNLERAQQLAAQLSNSDEAAILDTRGWVDYKSGNYRQAVQLLERASEKSAASPVLKYHLGMAQVANGDPQAARKNLEAALGAGKPFRGAEEAQSTLNTIKDAG